MTSYYIVQFLQGPPGSSGGYTTPNPPLLYNSTQTGAFLGAVQMWGLDTTSGSITITIPSAQPGQVLQADDYKGLWGIHQPTLLCTGGITKIQNPNAGAYVSSLVLNSYGGAPTSSYRWTYYAYNNGESVIQEWKLS